MSTVQKKSSLFISISLTLFSFCFSYSVLSKIGARDKVTKSKAKILVIDKDENCVSYFTKSLLNNVYSFQQNNNFVLLVHWSEKQMARNQTPGLTHLWCIHMKCFKWINAYEWTFSVREISTFRVTFCQFSSWPGVKLSHLRAEKKVASWQVN